MNRSYVVGPALAAALVCTGSANAKDLNFLLRGTFSTTGTQTCLESPDGFNPALIPNSDSITATTSSITTITYNGDGTASATAKEVVVVGSPFPSGSSDTISFDFTYAVSEDRTVNIDIPLINGQELTGPLAGQTFTVTNFAPLTGKLSEDGRSLTLAPTDPTIDTVAFSGGLVEHRICAGSRVSIKVDGRT